MGDHWNRDDDSTTRSRIDERIRGRATDEDEFDDVTEDQEEEDVDDDVDVDDDSVR